MIAISVGDFHTYHLVCSNIQALLGRLTEFTLLDNNEKLFVETLTWADVDFGVVVVDDDATLK